MRSIAEIHPAALFFYLFIFFILAYSGPVGQHLRTTPWWFYTFNISVFCWNG
uniref:Uncharacterized protein n=1 Tax=Anguilla anguilla TaxID=7936 RepID=A0A0E9RFI5_ANGAN